MAYKKSSEEIKWRKWKLKEEENLRTLGVDEDVITRLHTSDWEDFKADRNYQLHQSVAQECIERQEDMNTVTSNLTIKNLLDSIENEQLLSVLNKADEITLKILLLKMAGYNSKQVGQKMSLDVYAINQRIWRLRVKLKNIF